jgi:hypothetical protein
VRSAKLLRCQRAGKAARACAGDEDLPNAVGEWVVERGSTEVN